MGLEHGRNILIGDAAESFARAITSLFHDRELWLRLQAEGYRFVEENYSWRRGLTTLQHIVDIADGTWLRRRAKPQKKSA
jgi:glycosyltransferase involved in cell wall biosynthesis